MLMQRKGAALLIVDLQQRLLPAIDDGEAVIGHAVWLAEVAARLGVPTVVSEQYPQGLGHSDPRVLEAAAGAAVVEKLSFSCAADGCLAGTPIDAASQVVVCGTESHVCVLQTAIGLRAAGKAVFLVAEACGSRRPSDKALALARMAAAGIAVVSREMVAFEWLARAGSDEFREISKRYLR
ncbi:MAG: isochorismatase family protein [Rhodocyclaceae bacterium]|nr:isochorismatase family protein [Rhodocyclaceae bacterium]